MKNKKILVVGHGLAPIGKLFTDKSERLKVDLQKLKDETEIVVENIKTRNKKQTEALNKIFGGFQYKVKPKYKKATTEQKKRK